MRSEHLQQTEERATAQEGFTLIEVMVALVIFTFGILAILTLQVTSITGGFKAQDITEAASVGANQMERLSSLEYAYLADGTETVDGKYTVTWDVTANPPEAPANTTDIQIKVEWNQGGKTHEVAYDFLRARDI